MISNNLKKHYSFEQENNALFKVHCQTFAIARKITKYKTGDCVTQTGDHPFMGFRCFPKYRTEQGKALRRKVFFYIMLVGRKNLK